MAKTPSTFAPLFNITDNCLGNAQRFSRSRCCYWRTRATVHRLDEFLKLSGNCIDRRSIQFFVCDLATPCPLLDSSKQYRRVSNLSIIANPKNLHRWKIEVDRDIGIALEEPHLPHWT